jgi:hypothetical protein
MGRGRGPSLWDWLQVVLIRRLEARLACLAQTRKSALGFYQGVAGRNSSADKAGTTKFNVGLFGNRVLCVSKCSCGWGAGEEGEQAWLPKGY